MVHEAKKGAHTFIIIVVMMEGGDHDNNDHYLEVSQCRIQNYMLHVKISEL